ncbi:hypothetical protein F383_33855 [Gossypium arboreum]|uniref:Uncharacterized protein n=1 Tax=Gossypium arboreum TaxID=29729 RepID=A0A0B0N640_GOSAR|nr:hypothetical protein F383_33855 [Gossypium arboreum]
MEQILSPASSL